MSLDLTKAQWIGQLAYPAERVLIVTHVDPDGDAIGSLLGLGAFLRTQGKDVTLGCQDPVPDLYTWLPGAAEVVASGNGVYDLAIGLDCSARERMGESFDSLLAGIPLINIDHHTTNTRFGTANWIEPAAVATAQLVLALADASGWQLSLPIATCLLTGIVTDTRGFRTLNVGPQAMRAALRLVEAGASPGAIAWQCLDQRPLEVIRQWGEAIGHLTLEDGILWTEMPLSLMRRRSLAEDGTSGLTNFLVGVNEARIVAVFTERGDRKVDVGLRAAPGYDVAQVALRLGGGGHPQASGCTLEGSLDAVREQVLGELRHSLRDQLRGKG